MNVSKIESMWKLMEQGQFELAYARLSDKMAKDPNNMSHYLYNRALCLLLLNNAEEALIDFQKYVELRPETDAGYIGAGIALWWLNHRQEAVKIWQSAVNSKYTDAAGGVQVPALLFFAASQLSDVILEKKARSLLRLRWHRQSERIWPAPVAGFILGQIDKDYFLSQALQSNALRARRLSKAYFWIGLYCYRQGDLDSYKSHLGESLSLGKIIEPEYYLAKYELHRIGPEMVLE
jgi:lipoprotein NlpI